MMLYEENAVERMQEVDETHNCRGDIDWVECKECYQFARIRLYSERVRNGNTGECDGLVYGVTHSLGARESPACSRMPTQTL